MIGGYMSQKFFFFGAIFLIQNVFANPIEIYVETPITDHGPLILFQVHGQADNMVDGKLQKVAQYNSFVKFQDVETRNAVWKEATTFANSWKYDEKCTGKWIFGEYTTPCVTNGNRRIPQFHPTFGEDVDFVIKSAVLETTTKIEKLAFDYQKKLHGNAFIQCEVASQAGNYILNLQGLLQSGLWETQQSVHFDSKEDLLAAKQIVDTRASELQIVANAYVDGSPYAYTPGYHIENKAGHTSKYIEKYQDALDKLTKRMIKEFKNQNLSVIE